jgi:hypothetical protein
MRSVSNSLNHLDALKTIARTAGARDINIILEDDVVAAQWSHETFSELLDSLPSKFDVLAIGGAPRPRRYGEIVKLESSCGKKLPSVEAYIVSTDAARKLADAYLPFSTGHDVHMKYLTDALDMDVRVLSHPIFFDGSKTGTFMGTIYPNDYDLSYNEAFMTVKEILDRRNPCAADLAKVGAYFAQTTHNHPHFIYLMARYYKRVKCLHEAMQAFQRCFDIYSVLFCNVWKLDVFQLDYIHSCKLFAIAKVKQDQRSCVPSSINSGCGCCHPACD